MLCGIRTPKKWGATKKRPTKMSSADALHYITNAIKKQFFSCIAYIRLLVFKC